ncbi:MAG: GNAT family N-acetyltransferase [Chloroflexi bacterium]|nr:GNAT family N-acetyltransferase [Chloroflexota bacterium]
MLPSHGWHIRSGRSGDEAFLSEMLYEAAFWSPERPRPPITEALADPHLSRYLDGWGRDRDAAVVAIDADDRPIGAAWYRLFDASEPGYGFVRAAIPELSVAVAASHRGLGVGGDLLTVPMDRARAAGFAALSLSVEAANPALALYERHGFVQVEGPEGALTMRADLDIGSRAVA